MFDFTHPYLPLIVLLVLSFLAVGGTLAAITQAFRCAWRGGRQGWWVAVWAALAVPSCAGALTINFILDAIRHGEYF